METIVTKREKDKWTNQSLLLSEVELMETLEQPSGSIALTSSLLLSEVELMETSLK